MGVFPKLNKIMALVPGKNRKLKKIGPTSILKSRIHVSPYVNVTKIRYVVIFNRPKYSSFTKTPLCWSIGFVKSSLFSLNLIDYANNLSYTGTRYGPMIVGYSCINATEVE